MPKQSLTGAEFGEGGRAEGGGYVGLVYKALIAAASINLAKP